MKIENVKIDDYRTFLKEKYRSPSKGGNTSALHVHIVTVGGEDYTFLARGSKKWIYKNDKVSFEYDIVQDKYKNIKKETISTIDNNGVNIVRGDRRFKKKLRTTIERAPVSRREWRD